uniref:ABC transporter permease n=1 Tax=Candidatus Cryptobacteroides bacterium TaxID=3085639 RepID=UPI004024F687
MKSILSFIHKEFLHIFRDPRTMLIVLVMPIVQILLFGFAISTEVRDAVVDIVGDPGDATIREIAPKLEHNTSLSLGRYLDTPAQAEDRLKKGKSKAAIIFEKEYDRERGSDEGASVSVICDGADPNTAQMVGNYVKSVLLEGHSVSLPSPSVKLVYNPSMNSSYNFVPGVMGLILMLICSMMTAVSIVREKEFGTMELVLVSPVRPAWIIISKLIPYLV